VARYYLLRIRPGWVATPSPDTPGHSALRSLSEATNCEQPRVRTKLGVLFCDDSRRVSVKYCCSRLCFTSKRRFPPPWSAEDIGAAFVVQDSAGMRLAYCRGGIGVRDDGGAIGAREDGGTGVGLCAGVAGGCGGGAGIFSRISMTADCNMAISCATWF
jgi:hypothetical protein